MGTPALYRFWMANARRPGLVIQVSSRHRLRREFAILSLCGANRHWPMCKTSLNDYRRSSTRQISIVNLSKALTNVEWSRRSASIRPISPVIYDISLSRSSATWYDVSRYARDSGVKRQRSRRIRRHRPRRRIRFVHRQYFEPALPLVQ